MMEGQLYDVIIVGAGMSGMSTAAHLPKDKQLSVLMLEGRDRIGGRIQTEYINGEAIDLGASYVHMIGGNPIYHLAKRLTLEMVDTEIDPSENEEHSRDEDGAVTAAGEKDAPAVDEERARRVFALCFRLLFTDIEARVKEQDPPPALTDSVADYMRQVGRQELAPDDLPFLEVMLRMMSGYDGADLDLISSDHGFAGPDRFLKSGYRQIIEHLHEEAQQHSSFRLALSTPVAKIQNDDKGHIVHVTSKTGETFQGRQVIVTIPLGVMQAGDVAFDPPLSARRQRALSSLGTGVLNKLILVYPDAADVWWDIGFTHPLLFEPRDPLPEVHGLYLTSFRQAKALVAFMSAVDSPAFEALSDQEVTEWAHQIVEMHLPRQQIYVNCDVPKPIRGFGTRWRSDPYSKMSYTYIPKARAGQVEVGNAASPLAVLESSLPLWNGRLGFAGEATEPHHFSYAHGAFLSGKREAERIAGSIEATEVS